MNHNSRMCMSATNTKTKSIKHGSPLLFILLFLIFLPSINADSCDKDMQIMAKQLEHKDKLDTVLEIDRFVNDYVNQSYWDCKMIKGIKTCELKQNFYLFARNRCDVWKDRKGDCSDKANLKIFMIKYLGINTKPVHGVIDTLHDSFEFKLNSTTYRYADYKKGWLSLEKNFKKYGDGFW